ncbi:uncharacterized protein LOC117821832 [Notolabrus celidotus]|uniref:uncharacterized protein LOC117821832 n=1 Tax=Notolabrus celidotus TaxID=1203425 RepID=UPI0014905631|nr:uncharacterized protein LOC117821832 [Notolabrus celidotus]
MKTGHSLIFFLLLLATLQDGNACLYSFPGKKILLTGTVGGNLTFECFFDKPGQMKILCKDGCKSEDILVQTTEDTAQHGRYSMEVDQSTVEYSMITVYVSIADLTKSDSGRYHCKAGSITSPSEAQLFELKVEDAPTTPQPPTTSRPLFQQPHQPPPWKHHLQILLWEHLLQIQLWEHHLQILLWEHHLQILLWEHHLQIQLWEHHLQILLWEHLLPSREWCLMCGWCWSS